MVIPGDLVYGKLQSTRELIEERLLAIDEMYNAVADILYPGADPSIGTFVNS
jgi:hypothetical protein